MPNSIQQPAELKRALQYAEHCSHEAHCPATFEHYQHILARIARLEDVVKTVLNSDMAQREEDEGRTSETLNLIRDALGDSTVLPPVNLRVTGFRGNPLRLVMNDGTESGITPKLIQEMNKWLTK